VHYSYGYSGFLKHDDAFQIATSIEEDCYIMGAGMRLAQSTGFVDQQGM